LKNTKYFTYIIFQALKMIFDCSSFLNGLLKVLDSGKNYFELLENFISDGQISTGYFAFVVC